MIPTLKRTSLYQFKVPKFSGGVNLNDDIAYIKDNQLSDCNNMWFKDDTLKTRPGIRQSESVSQTKVGTILQTENINTVSLDGKFYTLECEKYISKEGLSNCGFYLDLKLCTKNETINIGRIEINVPELNDFNAIPIVYKSDIYVYLRHYNCIDERYENFICVFKRIGEKTYSGPDYIAPKDMYAPLVLTNCTGCYKYSGSFSNLLSKGATQVEGFNLLGNYYKMEFSMYDYSDIAYRIFPTGDHGEILDNLTYMEYSLPYTNKETPGEIFVEYFDKEGIVHKHTVTVPVSEPTVEKNAGDDGFFLHAFFKGNIVHFTLNTNEDPLMHNPDNVSVDDYVHNNMTVIAPCKNTDENVKKVMGMTQAIWYGNASLGVMGGSRLFLCGNIDEDEKSLVVWSDFENPLYFSENNYAYVGDKGQKTTGFGRQGASLIVFKERQIYSCDYSLNSVSAEELVEQKAIDLSTMIAGFTFKLIHSKIGCDCPKTIQLCFNKLLWATSEGKVYNLTERNQYSERNVVAVSGAIEKRLLKEDICSAYSADWNGYYLLFIKNKVYAMDYNSYEYMGISTYSLKRGVESLPSWYLWQLPYKIEAVYGDDENMLMTFVKKLDNENACIIRGYFDFNATDDFLSEQFNIISKMKTALFSLNGFERLKRITRVHLNMQGKQGVTVTAKLFSEQGDAEVHPINLNGKIFEGSLRTNKQIFPCLKLKRCIGLELTSSDYFELKEIAVNFKVMNNAK